MPPDLPQPRPTTVETAAGPLDTVDAPVLAVGFTRDAAEPATYAIGLGDHAAAARLGIDPLGLLEREQAQGHGGDVVTATVPTTDSGAVPTLLLVGLGTGTSRDYRRAGAAVARSARRRGTAATSVGSMAGDDEHAAFVEGLVLGSFGYRRRSEPRDDDTAGGLRVLLTDVAGAGTRDAVVAAATTRALASWRSRTYALTPSNDKGPVQLEKWAAEAASRGGLDLDVWDDDRLQAEGFGGILAVGSGSQYASRFLRLDYDPEGAGPQTPRVVLAGKGITFDSGGLSIKPRDAMMTMKRDMTGGGVVLAVMEALRDLGVRVRVTGLVASAENAFGAASMRPGDVVTHFGGRTSEVGNTDAEGRLVLADALAYTAAHIDDATAVVDVATLTGAARVALGTSMGALFANDDRLATALDAAGALAGEPVWRLPLTEDYEPLLESTFADATNASGTPGAITAALYLQHFAPDLPWAHLDIASVGDSPVDAFEYSLGATGFGARLLLRWLEQMRPAAPL